jgi:integrase/recombinase XerD
MRPRFSAPRAYAHAVRNYLGHFRSLGARYRGVECILRRLGVYLSKQAAPDLDSSVYENWRESLVVLHPNSRRKAEQIVHKFCRFRRRLEPGAFVPSPDGFTRPRPYVRPVIIEPEQVGRMLAAADALRPGNNSPLHGAVARVATILLYTAGLRCGELKRLQVQDIEPGGVLRIRESKFHKSRLIALSTSAQKEVEQYLRLRAGFATNSPDHGPFLCNRSRGDLCSYSDPGFSSLVHRLYRLAAVADREGRTPRIHDMRHSFAVQSLMQAYRKKGGDPQALLPKLALYMGHVSVESTMHYLKLAPQLALLASQRFDAAYGRKFLGGEP